jgi:phosphosulfolactate synthase (CoM biosynthesis protein A)
MSTTTKHHRPVQSLCNVSDNDRPRSVLREIIDICHQHEVLVSTGGFLEYVLGQSAEAVDSYVRECADLGFDIVEISCGFITIPTEDWLRLVEMVRRAGMKAKPEIGIQFDASSK